MDPETEMGPLSSFKQLETIEKNIKIQLTKVEKLNVVEKETLFLTKDITFLQQLLNVIIIIYLLQKMSYLGLFYQL
jgi:hypothetical protein